MLFKDVYHSNYLKADDFKGNDVVLTFKSVGREEFPDGVKPVARFEETDKKWVINRINFRTVASLLGEDSDSWVGRKVQLYATEVDFRGTLTLAIRVRPKRFDQPTVDSIESDPIPF